MQRYGLFSKDGLPLALDAEDVHGPFRLPVYGAAPKPTEEDPTPAAPIVGDKANPSYPKGVIPLSDEHWREFVDNAGRRRWDGIGVALYAPPPPPPVVPPVVFDYQFAGQAAAEGLITMAEAMAWTARGDVPAVLVSAVDSAVTDPDRHAAVMLFLAGSKQYPRHHALTPLLGPLLGKADDAALAAFWIAARHR